MEALPEAAEPPAAPVHGAKPTGPDGSDSGGSERDAGVPEVTDARDDTVSGEVPEAADPPADGPDGGTGHGDLPDAAEPPAGDPHAGDR
ncbi:hypothetical protein ACPCUV_26475 [Streptomyces platensis]|uniref:hypothetical protein n=1 Tax=Streptomyces platensis TaxID=58346 RepID=UPI003C2EB9FC